MKNAMLNVLIVIYNIEVINSVTVRSLLALDFKEKINLTIWNNGPEIVDKPDFEGFNSVNYVETISNISLAKIYNVFINDYCKIGGALILDHDTLLNSDDLLQLVDYDGAFECVIPKVYCNGVEIYPIRKRNICMSIASGIFLTEKYYKRNSAIFDERFYIYGVDTSFYIRCRKDNVLIEVQGVIEHSLSRLETTKEELEYGDFRLVERSYDAVLMFRLYPSFRNFIRMIRFLSKNHRYLPNKKNLLLSFIKGVHLGIRK